MKKPRRRTLGRPNSRGATSRTSRPPGKRAIFPRRRDRRNRHKNSISNGAGRDKWNVKSELSDRRVGLLLLRRSQTIRICRYSFAKSKSSWRGGPKSSRKSGFEDRTRERGVRGAAFLAALRGVVGSCGWISRSLLPGHFESLCPPKPRSFGKSNEVIPLPGAATSR